MAYQYGAPLENKTGLTEFEGLNSVDLLARLIYSEVRDQSEECMRAVAFVALNRRNLNTSEFGEGGTFESVILKKNAFSGMTTKAAREPDVDSDEWKASLKVAQNMATNQNPIGKCQFFVMNSLYRKNTKTVNGKTQYCFSSNDCETVINHYEIGSETFFELKR